MSTPQSPFMPSINGREQFNSILSARPEEEIDDFHKYMPKDLAVNVEQQRIFAEECMKKSGGFGRFQWIACAFLVLGVASSSLITQCIYMLELPPSYECVISGGNWTACTPSVFCTDGSPNGVEYRVDYTQSNSLDNWFTLLKLECQTKYTTSLFQVSFLIGILMGCVIFPKLADVAGRRTVFYLGLVMHIILVSTLFIVKEMQWFLAIIFLIGIEDVARFLIGYIYFSEFCLERHRPFVSSFAFFLATMAACFCAVYFDFICKNWIYLQIAGLVCSFISLISYFFIPESPKWLIASQQYKKVLQVYKKIAKVNGVMFSELIFRLNRRNSSSAGEEGLDPNVWINSNHSSLLYSAADSKGSVNIRTSVLELEEYDNIDLKPAIQTKDQKAQGKPKFTDVCTQSRLRRTFFLLILSWAAYMYCYYVLESFLRYTLENVFADTVVTCIAEAVAYPLSGFIYHKYGGKHIVTFGFVFSATLSLISIGFQSNETVLAVFIIGIKASLSMVINALYLLTFDSFPASYVASVFGVMQFLSRVVGIGSPYTVYLPFPIPQIIFAVFCLVTAIINGVFLVERAR